MIKFFSIIRCEGCYKTLSIFPDNLKCPFENHNYYNSFSLFSDNYEEEIYNITQVKYSIKSVKNGSLIETYNGECRENVSQDQWLETLKEIKRIEKLKAFR